MGELVTTVTKFKAKQGSENQLINELRNFDNSSSKSWQVLSLVIMNMRQLILTKV